MNEEIINDAGISPSTQVRVIADDGEQLGLLTLDAAIDKAYDEGLDLVLMANQSSCPVCRIMDYGKYCFTRDKREKEAKKKQAKIEVKEVQLSVLIDVNDFNTKANQTKKFLTSGNKVKVSVRFRGRQMMHPEIGVELLERFAALCEEVGTVDKKPVLEGKNMTMFLLPKKQ
ncbi:MAG: translation initiation factor IF-3 [Clostridia bacterium]|nr:translation initiation factor IF-3 [Clostridia bacterium]